MTEQEKINYLEFPARDFNKTKRFFSSVFDWKFTDYGSNYCAFNQAGIDGGFYKSELTASTAGGSVLIVFYSTDLHNCKHKIVAAGGTINKEIFAFPGGERFHFLDPNGNEFAVWSDNLTLSPGTNDS